MKKQTVDWAAATKPLIKKYKSAKHPLEARNLYQMMVEVVLSAQTTDA
jgi:endonuclease III